MGSQVTYTKQQLVQQLADLQASFAQAAEQTPVTDAVQRCYRAGLSDGFNIARLMAAGLTEVADG